MTNRTFRLLMVSLIIGAAIAQQPKAPLVFNTLPPFSPAKLQASDGHARAYLDFTAQQDREQLPIPIWPGSPVPGNAVYFSADRHTIIIVLEGQPGRPPRILHVPIWNDVTPVATETVQPVEGGWMRYAFTIANGRKAEEGIHIWSLLIPAAPFLIRNVLGPHAPAMVCRGGPTSLPVSVNQAALGLMEPGRYVTWFCNDERAGSDPNHLAAIQPGESFDGFTFESDHLPGFTTAWFLSSRLLNIDESWPDAVMRKVWRVVEDWRWQEPYLAVLAPRFAKTDPSSSIAENFLLGIRAWIKSGELRADAPFVSQALELLNHIGDSDAKELKISAAPETEHERLLAVAMQLSLGVTAGANGMKPKL